jgi:hypothetical protein
METESAKKISGGKVVLITLIMIISAFLIYYAVMSMMSPGRKLAAIKNDFGANKTENISGDKRILTDSVYIGMLKEKAFLQSRIAMAETDTIYLTINLADSSANIEISGVVVHKAKMSRLQASSILMKGNENIILSMLASPFTIENSISTIKKEPVMVKMAPKDTSEYKPDIMPDTSLTEPVTYILELNSGVRIYVCQDEDQMKSDRREIFMFDMKERLRNTLSSLKSVALFKVPEYHPYIKMRLPRADAKIIYRALPKNGQIAILK